MKQLTDTERLEVAMSLLGNGVKRDMYHRLCAELEQDCERNGFHNTPAECKNLDCQHCPLLGDVDKRREIGCPYTDC